MEPVVIALNQVKLSQKHIIASLVMPIINNNQYPTQIITSSKSEIRAFFQKMTTFELIFRLGLK